MTTPAPVQPDFRVIPIAAIDPPELAMRETMSDDGIASLAQSIRENGLLHPLGVIVAGERFRVAYGHRRRVALEHAGILEAPCFVYPEGTTAEEAMKVAENTEREAVNPAAEATYYRYLLDTKCAGDVRRLCALVNRREEYVQDRLLLTEADPDVLAALRAERISLAVARELNRVKSDTYRRLFLSDAINQGLTSAAVRLLRTNLERLEDQKAAQASGELANVPPSSEAPIESAEDCLICDSSDDPHDMIYVRVHRSCKAHLERKARAAVARQAGGQ